VSGQPTNRRKKAPASVDTYGLAAIDQVLDAGAEPVERAIEGARAAFGSLARDDDADPMLARILPNPPTAVACIANEPVWAVFRATRPPHLSCPPGISCGTIGTSCCCPGVNTRVSHGPFPAAHKCTLLLNPPWLRPHASPAGPFFVLQRHTGGPKSWCHRPTARPR